MPRPVYMHDVAREAGVHKSTVSLALRNHPRIPQETKERIRRAAERLGYRPNPMVTALMQLKRASRPLDTAPVLAFLTAHPGRYDWRKKESDLPNFFPGAVRRAKELGFSLEDFWLNEPGITGARMSQILRARGINGIVVAPLPPGAHELKLEWNLFSVVSLGVNLVSPLFHRIAHNHHHTMKMAISRCIEAGCRRIGFYVPYAGYHVVWEHWMGAYLAAQTSAPELMPAFASPDTSEPAFWEWFGRTKPDAIIFGRSDLPLWLQKAKVGVPEDVSLVSLHAQSARDPMSGVYYDPAVTGAEAINQLIALINRNEVGPPEQAHDFLIHGRWAEGKTLGKRTD